MRAPLAHAGGDRRASADPAVEGSPDRQLRNVGRRYGQSMRRMVISTEPFLDRSEPNDDESYDYSYEGTWITFEFGDGRSLRARRYDDTPSEAAIYFSDAGPTEHDAETSRAVQWLRATGVASVTVLGGSSGTYRPI